MAKAGVSDRMRVPHPVPYQGSKRKLTPAILACFPPGSPRLIEPFAGSAAVTLAAAARGKESRFVIADLNAPLMDLWRAMIEAPDVMRAWEACAPAAAPAMALFSRIARRTASRSESGS